MPNQKRQGWVILPNGQMQAVKYEINDSETEEAVMAAERSKWCRNRVGTPLPTKGIGKKAGKGNWRV